MAKYVQFKGVDSVVTACENRKAAAWSVWAGRQFMFKGNNADELETLLQSLEDSTEVYTLKVYDELKDVKQIKEKTECDGSFNFQLKEPEASGYRRGEFTEKIVGEISTLKQMIAERDRDAEDDEPKGIFGQIDKYLADPVRMQNAISVIGMIRGIITGNPQHIMNALPPGSLGNIPATQPAGHGINTVTGSSNGNNADMISEKNPDILLSEAITRLKSVDRNLHIHLDKLATLAENDRNSFDFLLQSLERL